MRLLRAHGPGRSWTRLWLADPKIVMGTIFAVATWKYIGFGIVLLLAGLQGAPQEIQRRRRRSTAQPTPGR